MAKSYSHNSRDTTERRTPFLPPQTVLAYKLTLNTTLLLFIGVQIKGVQLMLCVRCAWRICAVGRETAVSEIGTHYTGSQELTGVWVTAHSLTTAGEERDGGREGEERDGQ